MVKTVCLATLCKICLSSGYILDGCNNRNCILPKYYTFGRFVPDASIKAMQNSNKISVSNPAVLGVDIDCIGAIDYNDANDFECTLFDGDGNVIDIQGSDFRVASFLVLPETAIGAIAVFASIFVALYNI